MRLHRLLLLVALVALAVIVVAQNTEVVNFRFLFWTVRMSRIVLLSGTLVLGFSVGFILAVLLTVKGTKRSENPRRRTAGLD